jgi:hypothetical protein
MQPRSLAAGGPFRRLWSAYERQLQRHPISTQMTTSFLLWGVGDVLAQRLEHYEQQQAKKGERGTHKTPGGAWLPACPHTRAQGGPDHA